MEDRIPEDEKQRRLLILQEKQRAIQIRRNAELIGSIQEVLVEGRNQALGQWIGRTSCNRTLNFSHPDTNGNRPLPARTSPSASPAPAPTRWWVRAQRLCNSWCNQNGGGPLTWKSK